MSTGSACPATDSGGSPSCAADAEEGGDPTACGLVDTGDDVTDVGGTVACGDMTCGVSEYCYIECTCCGIPTDQPPSANYECRPIPAECSPDALCSCDEVTNLGGACDAARRTVERPCA